MAKVHSASLAPNGHYRVFIKRFFWLGRDQVTATKLVKALDLEWDQCKPTWTQAAVDRAFNFCGMKPPRLLETAETFERTNENPVERAPQAQTPERSPAFKPFKNGGITLHKGLDLFLNEQKARMEKGEIKEN